MIILTGATGFIGSVILQYLNLQGRDDIIIVDEITNEDKFLNIVNKKFYKFLSIDEDTESLDNIEAVIHFGADSNTLNTDWNSIYRYNVSSTRRWYEFALKRNAKFIFASSAAIYGNNNGPTNFYAFSKLCSEQELKQACILRLFNVYGPNEYHKKRMASTPFQWYNQARLTNVIKLFEGSNNFSRDFIFVEDVAKVVYYFLNNYVPGIYDVGTNQSVSFYDLCHIFASYENVQIEEIPMPDDLKKQYQTYSLANTDSLSATGFNCEDLINVKTGILKYLEYLKSSNRY